MHLLRRISLGILLVALLPSPVAAQLGNPCPVPELPCVQGGVQGLIAWFALMLLPTLRLIFLGICILYFSGYAMRLLLESEEESTITDVKNAYANGVVGIVLVSLATLISEVFDDKSAIITPQPIQTAAELVILYMRLIVSICVTGMMTFQGIRLIILQGQESELEQARKRFFHGLLGVAAVLMADRLVLGVMPGAHSNILGEEIVGLINFGLTGMGALAVFSIIIAGLFLIFSVQEELKDRAKKIIETTVVALAIVVMAYAIVNYMLFL